MATAKQSKGSRQAGKQGGEVGAVGGFGTGPIPDGTIRSPSDTVRVDVVPPPVLGNGSHPVVTGSGVSPRGVEVELLGGLMGGGEKRDHDPSSGKAVQAIVGEALDLLDDSRVTNSARRQLLATCRRRLHLLERFLDDPFVKDEKKVRVLLKALELSLKGVPVGSVETDVEGMTFRVRGGG